jgi:hypothetical protein
VVAVGAGTDAALGLLDDVAQGPACSRPASIRSMRLAMASRGNRVVAAQRCCQKQLKHHHGIEGDAAGDVVRVGIASRKYPKQRRCGFAQSGQTRCRNC